MNGLNIVFLVYRFYPNIGGIEVNAELLATQFVLEGNSVVLITCSEELTAKSFAFNVVRKPSIFLLLKKILMADVIFENNPCLRLSWPLFFLNKKSVIAIRTVIQRASGNRSWQDILKLWRLKKSTKVIAVSDYIRRVTFNDSIVIGNPYRKEFFKNLPDIKRTNAFVFIGRLVSDKGVDLALRAFRLYLDLNSNTLIENPIFTIIGDGPERKNLENLSNLLQLDPYVWFLGSKTEQDLVEELNKHISLIVPSLWKEPFGNVALEGMACGCIPIVSDGGGLPEAIGEAGLIFERENVEDLAEKMKLLMTDFNLQQKMINAQKSHLALHDPKTVAQKYLEVIKSAMN